MLKNMILGTWVLGAGLLGQLMAQESAVLDDLEVRLSNSAISSMTIVLKCEWSSSDTVNVPPRWRQSLKVRASWDGDRFSFQEGAEQASGASVVSRYIYFDGTTLYWRAADECRRYSLTSAQKCLGAVPIFPDSEVVELLGYRLPSLAGELGSLVESTALRAFYADGRISLLNTAHGPRVGLAVSDSTKYTLDPAKSYAIEARSVYRDGALIEDAVCRDFLALDDVYIPQLIVVRKYVLPGAASEVSQVPIAELRVHVQSVERAASFPAEAELNAGLIHDFRWGGLANNPDGVVTYRLYPLDAIQSAASELLARAPQSRLSRIFSLAVVIVVGGCVGVLYARVRSRLYGSPAPISPGEV